MSDCVDIPYFLARHLCLLPFNKKNKPSLYQNAPFIQNEPRISGCAAEAVAASKVQTARNAFEVYGSRAHSGSPGRAYTQRSTPRVYRTSWRAEHPCGEELQAE